MATNLAKILFEKWAARNRATFLGLSSQMFLVPFRNPFIIHRIIATFCHQLTHDEQPKIMVDANLQLIYVSELVGLFYDKHLRHES